MPNPKSILTDRSINIICAIQGAVAPIENTREIIQLALELLLASMTRQAQAGPVVYEVKGE